MRDENLVLLPDEPIILKLLKNLFEDGVINEKEYFACVKEVNEECRTNI